MDLQVPAPSGWFEIVIQHLSPSRKRLLQAYGVAILPGVVAESGRFALMALAALPDRYKLPLFRAAAQIPAFDVNRHVIENTLNEVWLSALEADEGGHGGGRWHGIALSALTPYEPLLRAISVGIRLLKVDLRSIELIGLWGDQWILACDRAIAGEDALGRWFHSQPAWKNATHARRSDKRWARRVLKRLREKIEAHIAWGLGLINEDRRWASNGAIDMVSIDAEWLEKWSARYTMVRQEDNYPMPLKDLVEGAARTRRAEDYAIAIGLQQIAERMGLHFVLATVTLPGEWSPKMGLRASEWNGASPAEANRALKSLMHKMRTNLVDSVAVCIGFCVTEPQKTGVPHCHVMLLTSDPAAVERIVKSYKENKDHQIDVRRWHLDPSEGRAASIASYLTKYLMKGHEGGPKASDGSPVPKDDAVYVDWLDEQRAFAAWRRGAATRTVSWFGLGRGFKGRWRLVFRSVLQDTAKDIKDPAFVLIRRSMDEKRWGDALTILGGSPSWPDWKQSDPDANWAPIRERRTNRFDEDVEIVVGYVLSDGTRLLLGTGTWNLIEDDIVDLDSSYLDDIPDRKLSRQGEPDPEMETLLAHYML